MARLKILFSASECFPFAKSGGLGDVAGALPLALRARGHDVRVVMPRYAMTKKIPGKMLETPLFVPMGYGPEWTAVVESELRSSNVSVPVYLIEHEGYFGRSGIYGDAGGGYGDNLERFGLLSRATIELCHYLDFQPDVIHAHDWQTSLIPVFLNTTERGTPLERCASVLTIHNLGYQGWFARGDAWKVGLYGDIVERVGLTLSGGLNLLKGAIHNSTIVSTVSPNYAREIQTDEAGEGLAGVLRGRGGDVIGVLNGIDDEVWNPSMDKHLAENFDAGSLEGKAACKRALQERMGLPVRDDVPLIGLVSRLVGQKGIDVFSEALPAILAQDVQVVLVGSGESWAEGLFQQLSHSRNDFRAFIGMNEALAHQVEAGADFFLMPSRYEPCGLNQMYSQRYGTLPIVRGVGGLEDTVENGVTGFKFRDLTASAVANTVAWAIDIYREDPGRFRAMQRRSMIKPLGWLHAARQYEALYRLAVGRRLGRF